MATKQAATTKSPTKKVPSKKPTGKKAAAKAAVPMKSFRLYKPTESFRTVRFSRQTIYWVILLAVITISQLWIVSIQLQIAELTNELIISTSDI